VWQGTRNRFKSSLSIFEHIIVPKAQHTITVVVQPSIPNFIACVLAMLPAIDFDDKAVFPTDEIDNVRSDRLPPYKLHSVE
jgi:hypothetical protein